ncbi:MAG: glycosyltransferase N-terminal domain-containing protein [Spirochaetota bacterium]|nr:glycosyltransferase N-terminal domain-containing protein [Spirochaetota bacterium]
MFYYIIIFIISIVARIASIFNKKIKTFFSLRNDVLKRIENNFVNTEGRKLVWIHAASAGEFEQAKPIIDHVKECNTDIMIAASFFSPSGYYAGMKYNKLDFCFNLPLDYRRNAKRLIELLNPELIIFSKYDIWTNLVIESYAKGIKLILISGTIPEKSFRHKFPFCYFFRKSYYLFDRIYAISEKDAERFIKIVGHDKKEIVKVSGDTRFDRVKTVIEENTNDAMKIIAKEEGHIYLIAGSTYKTSEKRLMIVAERLRKDGEDVRFIIVPHEVNDSNIERIKIMIKEKGFDPVILSNSQLPINISKKEILVVDRVGILAYLYQVSDIAFVGGSFKNNVHSILEPAIFGKPILTGPFIQNALEAILLEELGGLKICNNEVELYQNIVNLIRNDTYRDGVCSKVREFFKQNLGASERIWNDMKEIID